MASEMTEGLHSILCCTMVRAEGSNTFGSAESAQKYPLIFFFFSLINSKKESDLNVNQVLMKRSGAQCREVSKTRGCCIMGAFNTTTARR